MNAGLPLSSSRRATVSVASRSTAIVTSSDQPEAVSSRPLVESRIAAEGSSVARQSERRPGPRWRAVVAEGRGDRTRAEQVLDARSQAPVGPPLTGRDEDDVVPRVGVEVLSGGTRDGRRVAQAPGDDRGTGAGQPVRDGRPVRRREDERARAQVPQRGRGEAQPTVPPRPSQGGAEVRGERGGTGRVAVRVGVDDDALLARDRDRGGERQDVDDDDEARGPVRAEQLQRAGQPPLEPDPPGPLVTTPRDHRVSLSDRDRPARTTWDALWVAMAGPVLFSPICN